MDDAGRADGDANAAARSVLRVRCVVRARLERQVSWPYTPADCPRCRYFDPVEASIRDDAGYETVGLCLHPRIAMELIP